MFVINSLEFYKKNIEEGKIKLKNLQNKISVIGWLRLVIVIAMIGLGYYFYKQNNTILLASVEIVLLIIGAAIVIFHNRYFDEEKKIKLFIQINEKGINRINGEFKNIEDKGEEYLDDKHPYSSDLDIFGDSSLFQLINDTVTKGGREELANELTLKNNTNSNKIRKKQEAIKELGKKVKWRQKLIIKGKLIFKNNKKEIDELAEFKAWSKKESKPQVWKKLIAYIFILITFASVGLIIFNIIPISYIVLVFIINYIVIKLLTKDMQEELFMFSQIKNTVKIYAEVLKEIEDEKFESEYLKEIKYNLKARDGLFCKEEMKKLSNLLDWIGDSTSNAYYLVMNLFLFSDIFIIENLKNWKKNNGQLLENWLDVMAKFDALSSISNLAFDFEEWQFPKIEDKKMVCGKNIGHPLLGKRAVRNDYSLINEKKVTLITGSNMSGKSTFLRTVGLNLVLSYIGAPVYADEFACGVFNIYTCMRTKDNLEESISSFYAEILRIKQLIEATDRGEDVFFLLDEIFKGTNSEDRHTGAKELISQLISGDARGLVSTHDLELCDLEKEDNRIENYNFREYYEENKIKFDYKLRKGKSETQNAIHLMKLAGIKF